MARLDANVHGVTADDIEINRIQGCVWIEVRLDDGRGLTLFLEDPGELVQIEKKCREAIEGFAKEDRDGRE